MSCVHLTPRLIPFAVATPAATTATVTAAAVAAAEIRGRLAAGARRNHDARRRRAWGYGGGIFGLLRVEGH